MSTSPPDEHGPSTAGAPAADPPPPPGPRVSGADVRDLGRLRRSTTDRKVAGVAAGIARHLDIDPVVVRIAFVVLVFFGGGGLLLYGACWLFVPEDDTHQAVVNVDDRARTGILVAVVALAALATIGDGMGGFGFPWPVAIVAVAVAIWLALRNNPTAHPVDHGSSPDEAAYPGTADRYDATYAHYRPPPPADPRRRGPVWFWSTLALSAIAAGVVLSLQLAGVDVPFAAYGAVVVASCGLMLVVGAFYGRAGGLIPLGLLAAVVTLVLSVAAPIPGEMVSVGPTRVSPERLSDLDRAYAVGFGEIKIDLTETEIDGDHELDLEVGMGHIQVLVPEDGLAVEVEADIGLGEIKVFDDRYSDVVDDIRVGSDDDPVLTVTADGTVGQIEILTPGDLS